MTDSATPVEKFPRDVKIVRSDFQLSGKARKLELFTQIPQEIEITIALKTCRTLSRPALRKRGPKGELDRKFAESPDARSTMRARYARITRENTLCNFAAAKINYSHFARSLAPCLRDSTAKLRDFALSEFADEMMYVDGNWKLMLNKSGQAYRLFDLENDPHENARPRRRKRAETFNCRAQGKITQPARANGKKLIVAPTRPPGRSTISIVATREFPG